MIPTPKEGPTEPSEAEMDDKAWSDIVLQLNYDNYEEAKSIFLTRCAESAIEAVRNFEKEAEKRRSGLEEVVSAAQGHCPNWQDAMSLLRGIEVWVHNTKQGQFECRQPRICKALHVLTPTQEDKE